METPIVLTASQIIQAFLGVCGAITVTAGAIAVILKAIAGIKAPNDAQNKRLGEIEKRLKRHDELLDNDNKRLNHMEEGNKIILRALNALLRHGIDGNDINGMKEVHKDLESYLINKA